MTSVAGASCVHGSGVGAAFFAKRELPHFQSSDATHRRVMGLLIGAVSAIGTSDELVASYEAGAKWRFGLNHKCAWPRPGKLPLV